MRIRIAILTPFALLITSPLVFGQTTDCSVFHKGVFYRYFPISGKHYKITRDEQTQTDVYEGWDHNDTTLWHIDWLNGCDYTLQYIPNGTPLTKEREKFLRKHKYYYHLEAGGNEFCVYTETIDKPDGAPVEKDTLWVHERAQPATPLLAEIRSESYLRGMRFSDTSSYAVVFLYRPATPTFYYSRFDIYANGHFLCTMKDDVQHMYAVYRKGPFTLQAKYDRDTCSISLDIEPGKAYYVRSTLHNGVFGPRNYKVVLESIPADKGQKEFDRTFRHY